MNILITGGAGFIGSNLALELVAKGHMVTILDNLSPQVHGTSPDSSSALYKSIKNKVRFILGSVESRSDIVKSIKGQDVIVHFAAETGTGQSMYQIEKYTRVNIGGTALLLDVLTNEVNNVSKVVLASSRSIYGEGRYFHQEYGYVYPSHRLESEMVKGNFEVSYKDDKPLVLKSTDENSKIHPSSVYGITKQTQEQLVMTVCPTLNINPVSLRFQNVYGEGQSLSNPYTGILSIFSTQIRNGNEIVVFEDGKESRDFVHISDVVAATILSITKEEANGNIYNVGTGEATTVLQVAKTLVEGLGKDVPVKVSGRFRVGDIRHNYANIDKIKNDLGFSPKIDFNTGVKKFLKWVESQEVNEDRLSDSLSEMKSKGLFK